MVRMPVDLPPSVRLTWPLRKCMPPARLHIGSITAAWYVTDKPSAFAKAAVMMTSDRQLTDRDANACDAFRVVGQHHGGRASASRGSVVPHDRIESRILLGRCHKVLLDGDLAALYEVSTKRFNE